MYIFAGMTGVALAPQAATLPDTIVTKVAGGGWVQTLASVEQAIVGLGMLVLLVVIVMLLLALRKATQELTKLVQTSISDVSGAAHAVRNVADDVKGMTHSLRGRAEEIGETLQLANARAQDVMEAAEDRMRRFGVLVDVAQEEAEQFVVSTASTLRGVAGGASALRRGLSLGRAERVRVRHPRRRTEFPEREDVRRDMPRVRPRAHDEA